MHVIAVPKRWSHHWPNSRLLALLSASLVAVVLSGCSDNLATVEGNVTFNGEPVSRGMINLEPVDGQGPSAGGNIEEGRFRIKSVHPGDKFVRITAAYSKGFDKQPDGSEVEIVDDLLPRQWGRESNEQWKVEAPRTSRDFRIEGEDPRRKK